MQNYKKLLVLSDIWFIFVADIFLKNKVMGVKKLLVMALLVCTMAGMAQSTYEQIGDSVSAAFQQWLGQYEECGRKINEVSEQYQREVDKRGYPKKKTVQAKMALVNQYISLLKQERDSPELNQDLDVEKVNSKISMWQSQLEGLSALLKKI